MKLLEQIENGLEYPDDRNNSLSPMNQLLLISWFYASCGQLIQVADFMNVHISTACRIVAYVSRKIASLRPQYVKMQEPEESVTAQNEFHRIAGFPKVQALIDCTHVKIQSPDVVARWPGSTHDVTIFANSAIRARFEAGHFQGCVILGDSGYPLKSYLLTPLANPVSPGDQLYNEALIRTRNAIERTFGIWKRRFPVLAYGLRLKIETVLAIIVATSFQEI